MHDKVLRVLLTCGARILDLDYETTERQDEWMILDTIAASAKERVAAAKEALSLTEQITRARELDCNTGFPFEPAYFQGKNEYLTKIRQTVQIPLLRKDFTVDEYMIYEAKNIGADAVLLICAILSPMQLSEYAGITRELGLSALVEAHDEREVEMALAAGARIIGVNNRNLKDFTVDIHNSVRLRELVRENILFVSESGMKTRQDIARLEQNGTNAVLIGETLMRSADKKAVLQELRGQCEK